MIMQAKEGCEHFLVAKGVALMELKETFPIMAKTAHGTPAY